MCVLREKFGEMMLTCVCMKRVGLTHWHLKCPKPPVKDLGICPACVVITFDWERQHLCSSCAAGRGKQLQQKDRTKRKKGKAKKKKKMKSLKWWNGLLSKNPKILICAHAWAKKLLNMILVKCKDKFQVSKAV